ncbi:MAG: hypothetical protein OEW15_11240 [Nitrospirota bacterium]|nr:hypothetical protein [Nitrospirota bacterium]
MRCDPCSGTGRFMRQKPLSSPSAGLPVPGKDILAGTWKGTQGGTYEFINRGGYYELNEYGLLGRSGTGVATLLGNRVELQVTNVLLGRYSFQLEYQENTLRGSMKVLGIPVPMVLTRSEEQE